LPTSIILLLLLLLLLPSVDIFPTCQGVLEEKLLVCDARNLELTYMLKGNHGNATSTAAASAAAAAAAAAAGTVLLAYSKH